ncbi:hypothetical protein D3C79_980530 [compost metagenome]
MRLVYLESHVQIEQSHPVLLVVRLALLVGRARILGQHLAHQLAQLRVAGGELTELLLRFRAETDR